MSDEVRANEGRELEEVQAISFGKRLLTTLLDSVLVSFISMMIVFAISFVFIFVGMYVDDQAVPINALAVIVAVGVSLYYFIGSWSKSGQTLAKAFLGYRVVGSDGKPLTSGKAAIRYLGYIVSAILMSLGFLWVAFDKKRQGLHDKMARSYVIYSDAKLEDPAQIVPADSSPGWVWLVVWFVAAVLLPVGALTGLIVLGPVLNSLVTSFLRLLTGLF